MMYFLVKISCLSLWFVNVLSLKTGGAAVSLTKFDHFVKVPFSNIHTGGRLTERQIGYIATAGYASILSVVEFSTNDTIYNGMNGTFPSSSYEAQIASSYGLNMKYLASSLTLSSLVTIVEIIDTLPKPLYIHCHVRITILNIFKMHLQFNKRSIY